MPRWIQTSKELVLQSFLFRLFKVGFRSEQTGKEGLFDVLETKDWMNVIPITPENEVLMVRQFRYGIGADTLEFPAGQVEPGHSPLDTARRELLEETGAEAVSIEQIGWCQPNPAFLNNHCFHFLARGVVVKTAQKLDEHEEVEIVKVPLTEIPAMIADGRIAHSLSIVSWCFFRQRES